MKKTVVLFLLIAFLFACSNSAEEETTAEEQQELKEVDKLLKRDKAKTDSLKKIMESMR